MRLLRLTLISNNLLLIGPRLIGIVYPANSLLNARTTDHLVVRATVLPAHFQSNPAFLQKNRQTTSGDLAVAPAAAFH